MKMASEEHLLNSCFPSSYGYDNGQIFHYVLMTFDIYKISMSWQDKKALKSVTRVEFKAYHNWKYQ